MILLKVMRNNEILFRMIVMNSRLVVLLIGAALVPAVQARAKNVLPDACGDDAVKFSVNAEQGQSAPTPPPDGKAQIVFTEDEGAMRAAFTNAAFRYGIDGAWVGATRGNSYFALNVEPGVHQLCISPQSSDKKLNSSIQIATLTTEPGKVYYLAAQFTLIPVGLPGPPAAASGPVAGGGALQDAGFGSNFVNLIQLSEAAGKYRVKAWKLATWKTNK
jgi:hypothetical protein